MDKYEAEFVERENGNSPFEDFLEQLGVEEQMEVLATIDDFLYKKNNNHPIKEKLCKKLQNDIFELRTNFADGIARTLFFYMKGKRVIITHGFVKKTQKTPPKEIKRAVELKDIHLKKEKK